VIRSMTGFGETSRESGGTHYFLEIRSLNSKYFKAVIRLPEGLQGLEAELETALRHRINRGSVFLTVHVSESSADAAHQINHRALGSYIEAIKRVPQVGGGEVQLDLGALLTLPGVLQPPANEEERLARARTVLLELLEKAVANLVAMREKEGTTITTDLLQHRELIAERIRVISARAPQVIGEYEKRLRSRIEAMITDLGVTIEAVDIVREIAIAAERSDTSEEIARLSAHISQFTELLDDPQPKPIGRTLDFLTQEMLREANTIASKCADAEIARWIVEVKGAIDRIKEQVQNVE
jgi:uncharacterized protein (TIGR00255 family)